MCVSVCLSSNLKQLRPLICCEVFVALFEYFSLFQYYFVSDGDNEIKVEVDKERNTTYVKNSQDDNKDTLYDYNKVPYILTNQ